MSESEIEQHKADLQALRVLQADASELEQIESLLNRYNVFEAIGFVGQEIRHSRFLAFLLDPKQSHGLGDLFLKRFLQESSASAKRFSLPLAFESIEDRNLDQTTVTTEAYTDDGRIDILLLNEVEEWAMIIENKIWTSEHSDQLKRYHKFVQDNYPSWQVFGSYLTPYGTLASLNEKYLPLSYGAVCEIVDSILEDRGTTLNPDVRMSMRHYVQMVRRHIVGDPEVVNLARSLYEKHQRALDLIYEHRPDAVSQVKSVIEKLVREDPRFELEGGGKNKTRFAVIEWDTPALMTGQGWTRSGRILMFEFWHYPDGCWLLLLIGPGSEGTRQRLYTMVRSNTEVFELPPNLGNAWSGVFTHAFLEEELLEAATDKDREKEIHRHWEQFLREDLPRIDAALKREPWVWESVERDEEPSSRSERFVWRDGDIEITKRPEDEK